MEKALNFDLPANTSSIIKVIGVGGGGSNAVNYMYNQGIKGVDFIICNTDAQALDQSPVPIKVQLGKTLTEGRGAGAMPEVGRNAAIESLEDMRAILADSTTMVFITAGMGGGTGTGAAPVIAKLAKEMGILTVGIVTQPFVFEGRKRTQQADSGLQELKESVDTLLIIENDKLRSLYGNLKLNEAFGHADEVLCTAAKGIAEVITLAGTVNVDMNDVKTVMKDSGRAIMGSGKASGEGRAMKAVQDALESPLLNNADINGARFILLNIMFGTDELLMDEVSEITDYIQLQAGNTAEVIWGYGHDNTLGEEICITVIATGFSENTLKKETAALNPEKVWLNTEVREITSKVEKPVAEEILNTQESSWEEQTIELPEMKEEIVFTVRPIVEENTAAITTDEFVQAESDFILNDKVEMEVTHDVHSTDALALQEVENTGEATLVNLEEIESTLQEVVTAQKTESEVTATLDHKTETQTHRPTRAELNSRNKEREMRIREFTLKLKTSNGLQELESEPAYSRKRVSLDTPTPSHESNVARFSLQESLDENGRKKIELKDNPFLHDNVD
jgi:cell division protein FtsZ